MQLKEIIVENYMQALLKAALLLGDPERTEAIRRIAVCAYRPDDSARRPLPRCTSRACDPADGNVEYRILYPEAGKRG